MAAWTEDEGLLFLAVFLAATALFRRRAALGVMAGALPRGSHSGLLQDRAIQWQPVLTLHQPGGAGHRLVDVGRYATVIGAFGRELLAMASGWYHPIFAPGGAGVALRFDPLRRSEVAYAGSILGTLLAGYAGVYLITANNLNWQLQTSLRRLLVQAWPVLILAGFVGLRAPEAAAIVKPAAPAKARKKAGR